MPKHTKIWSYKKLNLGRYALMVAEDPKQESRPTEMTFELSGTDEGLPLLHRIVAALNAEEGQWVRDNCCCERMHLHHGVPYTRRREGVALHNGVDYLIFCPKCVVHGE